MDEQEHSGFIDLKLVSGMLVKDNEHLIHNRYQNTLTMTQKFVNLSSYPIVVSMRDGTYSILPPQVTGDLIESVVISIEKNNRISAINIGDGEEDDDLLRLRKQLNRTGHGVIYWEEIISIDELKENRNGVYVSSVDVVLIMSDRLHLITQHPFSKQRIKNIYLNPGDNFNPKSDLSMTVTIVDNTGLRPRYYVVVNDRINTLVPRRSNTLDNGVYICGLTTLETPTTNTIRRTECYSIEECLKGNAPIKLFLALTEAQDEVYRLLREESKEKAFVREHEAFIAKAKREKELIEQENILLKIQQVKDKAAIDEIEAKRAAELLKLKMEMEKEIARLKEESAIISSKYKTITEGLKFGTAIIGVAFTIYKLLK